MNINDYLSKIKCVNKFIKSKSKLERYALLELRDQLIMQYEKDIKKECNHNDVIDIGYFKERGKDLMYSKKEEADFRIVECIKCKRQIYLFKTDDFNWDILLEKQKIKIKK